MTMKTLDGLIESRAGHRSGAPTIAGTGISVARIAFLREEGLDAERIVKEVLPQLSLAQVLAALAYFELNRTEIARFVREEAAEYDRLVGLAEQGYFEPRSRSGAG